MVTVKDQPASGADMRPHGEGLLDDPLAAATLLGGPGGLHCQHRDAVRARVVLHPAQESAPASVLDAFREVAVPDHMADLEVFNGYQIVR